jgi:hypothetical protein
MEFLDLLLGSLQMGAHLHDHILVMHHKHPRNIGLDPRSLELVLLPLWQQVIDGAPQLIMISATVGGDCLPYSVSYCILVSGPEGWTLVSAEHIRSADDLHDCLVLFSARAHNSLDSKLWRSGDVDAVQQIPQSTGGDRGFISKSFDLVGVVERLVLLCVAPRSVVFILFIFSLVALFFFFLFVFFLPLVMVIVLWHLLSFLRVFPYRYCDHNLEGVLPLRNVLRGVVLRLWLGWHIPWH